MNSKIKTQILEWSESHLIPNSSCNTKYYNLRFTSGTVKRNLVPNYGDTIYVSKRGKVFKRVSTNLWKELSYSVTIHYNGIKPKYYVYVNIKGKHLSLSRLVATVWVIKINPNYNIVMHLDDDRLNNHYTNLQWGTQKDNINMAVSRGHYNKPHRDRRLTIEQEDQLLEELRSGNFSQRELASKWGFKSQGSIQSIIKRSKNRSKYGTK